MYRIFTYLKLKGLLWNQVAQTVRHTWRNLSTCSLSSQSVTSQVKKILVMFSGKQNSGSSISFYWLPLLPHTAKLIKWLTLSKIIFHPQIWKIRKSYSISTFWLELNTKRSPQWIRSAVEHLARQITESISVIRQEKQFLRKAVTFSEKQKLNQVYFVFSWCFVSLALNFSFVVKKNNVSCHFTDTCLTVRPWYVTMTQGCLWLKFTPQEVI